MTMWGAGRAMGEVRERQLPIVILADAGISWDENVSSFCVMDSRLRGNDNRGVGMTMWGMGKIMFGEL